MSQLKYILRRVSFIASTLLVCLLVPSCGNNYAANIEAVLQQDQSSPENAESIQAVVDRMRAINLDGCPKEFISAYLAHIHAWESLLLVEQEAMAFSNKFTTTNAMVSAFMRGLVFDFGIITEESDARTRLNDNYLKAVALMKQTHHRVEEIAIVYGAKTSRKK